RIGEVDRCGSTRQRNQHAPGREAENLILEQLQLGVLQEVLGTAALRKLLYCAAQPGIRVGVLRNGRRRSVPRTHVLVDGVGRDAIFGDRIHLMGAYLEFDALAGWADDRGVNGTVVVLLRRRDIVLEATR